MLRLLPYRTMTTGLLVTIALLNGNTPTPAAVAKNISTGINPATGGKVPNNTRQST